MNRWLKKFGKGRQGMTLTELAIVLACIGFVMGALWVIATAVWNSYNFRVLNQQIVTVVQNVRAYYDPLGGLYSNPTAHPPIPYADGSDITAILSADVRRLIPAEMRENQDDETSVIHHALGTASGGSFLVTSEHNGLSFRVRLLELRKSECMRLLLDFPVVVPEMGVQEVKVNGTAHALDINDPVNLGSDFPVTAATATAWCNIDEPASNEVSFVFKLKN